VKENISRGRRIGFLKLVSEPVDLRLIQLAGGGLLIRAEHNEAGTVAFHRIIQSGGVAVLLEALDLFGIRAAVHFIVIADRVGDRRDGNARVGERLFEQIVVCLCAGVRVVAGCEDTDGVGGDGGDVPQGSLQIVGVGGE